MANLTIRNLDERLKGRLRVRAASLGRSMEEEARRILQAALDDSLTPPVNLANRIRSRFAKLGGVELPIAPREPLREQALPVDVRALAAGARKARPSKAKRRA
jgi:antitoxin FitA